MYKSEQRSEESGMNRVTNGMKKSTKQTLQACSVPVILMVLSLLLTACSGEPGKKEIQQVSEQMQDTEEQATEEHGKDGKSGGNSQTGTGIEADREDPGDQEDPEVQEKAAKEPAQKEAKELREPRNGDYLLARPSQNGALSVKGTKLVDEQGQEVQLRGISTHGIAWFPQYVNEDAMMQLSREWGANLFRIAMYSDENGGYCTDGDKEKLKALIMDGVAYAKEADMYVIVDWHILHDGNPQTHKEEALKFFDEMSGKLKNEKHVIYEICNEPNGNVTWTDVKSYAEEIIPVIRKNAPDAIILIGTPTWSQEIDEPQKDPVTGYDNIMYTLHFYAATHKAELRNRMKDAIASGTPVLVSEYGLCDASGNGANDLTEAQNWIDTMDKLGVSYAAWSFCNKDETAALIRSSCQKTSGFTEEDLSESGRWIYDMLHERQNPNEYSNTDSEVASDVESSNKSNAGINADGDLEVRAKVIGNWESDGKKFYQYQLTVTNRGTEAVSSWEISVSFSEDITLSDGWNGEYTVKGKKLTIHSKDYNGAIEAGESASDIGFIVSASEAPLLQ